MRWILASVFLILLSRLLLAATTPPGTIIQGGKLVVQGGYMAIGPSQASFTIVVSTGGQPIGMLMGLTYSN